MICRDRGRDIGGETEIETDKDEWDRDRHRHRRTKSLCDLVKVAADSGDG